MERRKFLSVAALGLPLSVAGCTGGAPASNTTQAQETAAEQQIRVLMGQPEDPADLEAAKKDIGAFEKANPGITVKLDVMPNDTIRTVLQTQLRSGQGPDVFGYDTGPGFAGALAKAGLLYDLTQAYADNNWPIYDFAKLRVTFDGKLVGIPSQLETVGVFYNKDAFTKAGVGEIGSIADLTTACKKLKDADYIPMSVSDKEGWQGGHLLSMSLASDVGSQKMMALINGEQSWDSPEVVTALKVWSDLGKGGYLTPSPTAVSYDNANALFYQGKAAMNPTGSWLQSDIEKNAKFEVGYIPFPGASSSGIFCGGLGSGTFISAATKKAAAAIKFLNWGMTPEHGRWSVETLQDIPAFPVDTNGIEASPLFKQILDDTAKIAEGTGDFGYNIDVLTTDAFNQAMWKGMQSILTGKGDPAKVAKDLQVGYEKGKK